MFMKKKEKENLVLILSSMFLIFGILFTINFYLTSNIMGMVGSLVSIIIGLILLAKVFG